MYPDRLEAERLLKEAEKCNPGPWGNHSRTVAHCAEKIASSCGLDCEKAYVLGLLHDIGRKFGVRHLGHVSDGYTYMMSLGYDEVAKICLTHSFNHKDISAYVGNHDTSKEETELITKSIDRTQYKNHTHSNIEVIKCVSQTFSSKGLKNNFGFYSLLACFTSFIGVVVSYAVKYSRNLDKIIISNPPIKSGSKTEDSGADSHRKSQQVDHHNPDDTKNDYDYINAKYEDALENKEQRTFLQNYLTFLKLKQMFIFTFFTTLDRNLRVVKIGLFILFVSFYFAFTALFFNDSIMRKIYEYKGNTDAAVHVPNIILSSLCCIVMNILVKFVSLSERDMYKIRNENKKEEKDKIKKKIKIKTYILFGVSIALILFFWYYVSAFCAVFKNSQVHYLINVVGAFIVCNIWPFVTSLIAPFFRTSSLKSENNSPCMYKFSQIISYL